MFFSSDYYSLLRRKTEVRCELGDFLINPKKFSIPQIEKLLLELNEHAIQYPSTENKDVQDRDPYHSDYDGDIDTDDDDEPKLGKHYQVVPLQEYVTQYLSEHQINPEDINKTAVNKQLTSLQEKTLKTSPIPFTWSARTLIAMTHCLSTVIDRLIPEPQPSDHRAHHAGYVKL